MYKIKKSFFGYDPKEFEKMIREMSAAHEVQKENLIRDLKEITDNNNELKKELQAIKDTILKHVEREKKLSDILLSSYFDSISKVLHSKKEADLIEKNKTNELLVAENEYLILKETIKNLTDDFYLRLDQYKSITEKQNTKEKDIV